MTRTPKKTLQERIADADERGSRYLADANEAAELVMTLDEICAALCKGEFSSLSISFNDLNGPNYQTVAGELEHNDMITDDDFVGGATEREKCIATNSLWSAQWYPDTPVGFYVIYAATFETLRVELERIAIEGVK